MLHFVQGVSRDHAGTYTCEAANQHGVQKIRTALNVVYEPKCNIFLIKKPETFVMECKADGNPKNFTFSWKKNNLTFSKVDSIHDDSSMIELELKKEQFGAYYCHVKNNKGSGNLCKIHVDFQKLGIPLEKPASLLMVGTISSCLLISILSFATILCMCIRYLAKRRKRPRTRCEVPSQNPPPDVTKDIHPNYSKYHNDGKLPVNRLLDYPTSDVTLVCDDNKCFISGKGRKNHLL